MVEKKFWAEDMEMFLCEMMQTVDALYLQVHFIYIDQFSLATTLEKYQMMVKRPNKNKATYETMTGFN